MVRGKVQITVGEEVFILEAGDACRHPQDVPHGIVGVEDALVLEIKSPAQEIGQLRGTDAIFMGMQVPTPERLRIDKHQRPAVSSDHFIPTLLSAWGDLNSQSRIHGD